MQDDFYTFKQNWKSCDHRGDSGKSIPELNNTVTSADSPEV